MYCFPEKLHFNLQSDLTYFISHVKAIINGFGYATVLDVLDLLKTNVDGSMQTIYASISILHTFITTDGPNLKLTHSPILMIIQTYLQ